MAVKLMIQCINKIIKNLIFMSFFCKNSHFTHRRVVQPSLRVEIPYGNQKNKKRKEKSRLVQFSLKYYFNLIQQL